jgi:hypothetical protein
MTDANLMNESEIQKSKFRVMVQAPNLFLVSPKINRGT